MAKTPIIPTYYDVSNLDMDMVVSAAIALWSDGNDLKDWDPDDSTVDRDQLLADPAFMNVVQRTANSLEDGVRMVATNIINYEGARWLSQH